MNNILVHKHLIVRAEVYRPPMDENFLTGWLNELTENMAEYMAGQAVAVLLPK